MHNIINQITALGFIVTFDNCTTIEEPFTSNVTGKQYNRRIGMSSQAFDWEYLKESLPVLENWANQDKTTD